MTKHKKKTSPVFAQKSGKVGKKKRPENETRTVFKARLISVPMQAALEREQQGGSARSEALTHRKLSLGDLLPRLTHSSSQVRQEALLGIRDLAREHPGVVRMSVGQVLEKLSQLVTDPDKTVRSHLRLAFVQVLWALPASSAAPFMHLVVAYLCSGMTYSSEAVKADAIELAALVLERYPPLATDYSRQLLPRFGALIAPHSTGLQALATTTSTTASASASLTAVATASVSSSSSSVTANNAAGNTASFTTRTKALGTLLKFLHALVDGPSAAESEAVNSCDSSNDAGLYRGLPAPGDLSISARQRRSAQKDNVFAAEDAAAILVALHPGLIELWHEATPLTPLTHAQTLKGVLETIDLLLGAALCTGNAAISTAATHLSGCLDDYVRCVHPFFPFDSTGMDEKGTAVILELNLLVCRVFAHFLTAGTGDSAKCKTSGVCACWAAPLICYVRLALRGYLSVEEQDDASAAAANSSSNSSEKCEVKRLPAHLATLVARALPVLQPFLAHLARAQQPPLRRSFMQFCEACPPASTARLECIRFAAAAFTPHELLGHPDTSAWVSSLPKLLWQLKDHAPATSAAALALLLTCAKTSPAAADTLQPALVPFFYTVVQKNGSTLRLFGPFLDLPEELRRTALCVLHYFAALSRPMERALVACICSGRLSATCLRLAVELVEYHHCWKTPSLPALAASYAAVLANLPTTTSNSNNNSSSANTTTITTTSADIVAELCASLRRIGADYQFAATCGTLLESAASTNTTLAAIACPFLSIACACSGTCTTASMGADSVPPRLIAFLTVSAAHVLTAACVDGGKDKATIGIVEALLAAYPLVLGELVPQLAGKVAASPETASLQEWAALARLAEMPALRRPGLLLGEKCRALLVPLISVRGVPHHIISQYSEFCQIVSTLYSL